MATLVHTRNYADLLDSFFGRPLVVRYQKQPAPVPAVNVKEAADAYSLYLAAPGAKKEDFSLNLEQNRLTISYKPTTYTDNQPVSYTRREFGLDAFERSFRLPKNVDTGQISAAHTDGVLHITLPKLAPATDTPAVKQIAVS